MAVELDRTQVLAHRVAAQGLHGDVSCGELNVLTLGLQDTPSGSAALGLRQRTGDGGLDRPELVIALTVRGSPHVHRRDDLPLLRAALRPVDNEMLRACLGGYGDEVIASGADGPALLDTVVEQLRAVFPGETVSKGELSGAVSPRLPEVARPWCGGCGVAHIAEGLFRLGTLYAGIELEPHDGRRQRFRLGPSPEVADGDGAMAELLRTHLRLAGPASLGDLVVWLDTRSVTAPPDWLKPAFDELRDELEEVRVDGVAAKLFADAEAVVAMADAPEPPAALMLPPRDPFVLGSRPFLVPDRAAARTVWRPTGSPGASSSWPVTSRVSGGRGRVAGRFGCR